MCHTLTIFMMIPNHAVHLRAVFCDVWCNRVVRRRGFMRPLHAAFQARGRAGAPFLDIRHPFLSPALPKSPANASLGDLYTKELFHRFFTSRTIRAILYTIFANPHLAVWTPFNFMSVFDFMDFSTNRTFYFLCHSKIPPPFC